MSTTGAATDGSIRPELLEVLACSLWVQETARARVFARWHDGFEDRARLAAERAELAASWARARNLHLPEQLAAEHTAWLGSFAGDPPAGAGFLDYAGTFMDTYIGSRLGFDLTELRPENPLPTDPSLGSTLKADPVLDRTVLGDQPLPPPAPSTAPCFAVLMDLHVGASPGLEALAAAVEELNVIGPQFVLVGGDLTERGEPEEFTDVHRELSRLDVPWYAVLGNHDVVRQSTGAVDGTERFERVFSSPSQDRILECGDLQAVLVDSADPTPWTFPIPQPDGSARVGTIGVIGGRLHDTQVERLAAETDPRRPLLLVSHHQLQPYAGFPALLGGVLPRHSDALLGSLAGHDVRGALVGHTHRCALSRVGPQRISQLELPAIGKWPFAYTVVTSTPRGPEALVRQLADPQLVHQLSPGFAQGNWVFGLDSTLRRTFTR